MRQEATRRTTRDQVKFFESRIRPVLTDRCYSCHSHSAKEVGGSLLLDSREGVRHGGDSGPAIAPGNPAKSLLIKAIRYKDSDRQMPPKDAGGKLPDAVIRDFETWIKMGAPDPRIEAAKSPAAGPSAKARDWWAFQPRKAADPPAVKKTAWAYNDIDRFVLAKLEAEQIEPVEDALPRTLLRRLSFDLTGLPPRRRTWGRSCATGIRQPTGRQF